MAGRGRPRKSVAQLKLDGTFRHDRHGDPDDQWQPEGEPVKPLDFDAFSDQLWEEVVPELVSCGVATSLDTAELTAMCEWWSRYKKITEKLKEYGTDFSRDGYYSLQMLAGSAWKNFSAIGSRFGLSPADRTRLGAMSRKDNPKAKLKAFVAGRDSA